MAETFLGFLSAAFLSTLWRMQEGAHQTDPGQVAVPKPEVTPQSVESRLSPRHALRVRVVRRTGPAAHKGGGLLQSLSVQVLALFTPFIVAGSMSLALVCSRLLVSLARLLFIPALIACPLIGYFVTVKLCRLVCRIGGTVALQHYLRGTVLSFILWGILTIGVVGLASNSHDDGAGLLIVPLLFGGAIAFVIIFIVWAWSASTVWAAQTGDEGPSVPWWS